MHTSPSNESPSGKPGGRPDTTGCPAYGTTRTGRKKKKETETAPPPPRRTFKSGSRGPGWEAAKGSRQPRPSASGCRPPRPAKTKEKTCSARIAGSRLKARQKKDRGVPTTSRPTAPCTPVPSNESPSGKPGKPGAGRTPQAAPPTATTRTGEPTKKKQKNKTEGGGAATASPDLQIGLSGARLPRYPAFQVPPTATGHRSLACPVFSPAIRFLTTHSLATSSRCPAAVPLRISRGPPSLCVGLPDKHRVENRAQPPGGNHRQRPPSAPLRRLSRVPWLARARPSGAETPHAPIYVDYRSPPKKSTKDSI